MCLRVEMKYKWKHKLNISNKRQGKETDNFAIERFVMNWKPRIETWMEMNHARTVRIMIQGPKKMIFQSDPPLLC